MTTFAMVTKPKYPVCICNILIKSHLLLQPMLSNHNLLGLVSKHSNYLFFNRTFEPNKRFLKIKISRH